MKHSLRKAINQACRDCLYDSHSPGAWRQQIEACTDKKCALYAVRPLGMERSKRGQKTALTIDPLTISNSPVDGHAMSGGES